MLNLGVNVDHVATVRQARLATLPSPLQAAALAEEVGAWGITAHLREDRRHIQDADIEALAKQVKRLNMEMAVTDEMISIASRVVPHSCCLVPEKRKELTTEGGLDVVGQPARISDAVKALHDRGIVVSLFIDPDEAQIKAAAKSGADYIEMHTGAYSNASGARQMAELERLRKGSELATRLGLRVNAGHGIDYLNMKGILTVPHLNELNIGHSIIGRAVMVGMRQAVAEMLELMAAYE
ncbi:MAG: pyridoxine 5'-phosphate synthase [Victivallaceae bacterium]|nr:pyridoxine 5'-phosphate synthase [Victivallaceae bacterium]